MQTKTVLQRQGIFFLLSLILLLFSNTVFAQSADEEFSRAQSQFQNGNYQQALQGFQRAKSLGIKGVAIEYNLGVTFYKLKQYRQAIPHFEKLLEDKGMRPLAAFNLGLVYDKLGQRSAAVKWFRQAYDESGDRKLKSLAWQALDQLGIKVDKPFQRDFTGMLGLLYGSDSNVVDPVNPASSISDSFTEFYAAAYYDFAPSLRFNSFLMNQDYSLANAYDFQIIDLGLEKSFTRGDWKNSVEGIVSTSTLGGQTYQDTLGGQLLGSTRLGDTHELRLRYRYEQISSAARSYLQGSRQKFRVERRESANRGNKWMYELEMNDRANSATTSYSPTRHTLRYYRSYHLSDKWSGDGYVGLRTSSYSTVAGVTREDQRIRFKARLRRDLGKRMQFIGEYSYSNNNSSVSSYSYSRNILSLGIRATF